MWNYKFYLDVDQSIFCTIDQVSQTSVFDFLRWSYYQCFASFSWPLGIQAFLALENPKECDNL